MSILDYPIRVDNEAERIITHNGGATLDFNGNEVQRREAMRLFGQIERFARIALDAAEVVCEDRASSADASCERLVFDAQCGPCRARSVPRNAGVLP